MCLCSSPFDDEDELFPLLFDVLELLVLFPDGFDVPLFVVGLVALALDELLTVPLFDTGDVLATASFFETSLLAFFVTTVFLFPFSSVTTSVTATSPSATSGACTILTFNFFEALFLYLSWIVTFKS